MPTAVHIEIAPQPVLSPPRKQWTRDELAAIESAGLLEGQRLELIEGELIQKVGKNRPHTVGLWLLMKYLISVFTIEIVQQEAPIDVHPSDTPTSEPEPDIIVLKRSVSTILKRNPLPNELQLVCEISDSTLAFDLTKKAALYARAAIPEYWILDLVKRQLIIHREPTISGYKWIQAFAPEEQVSPLTAPQSTAKVLTLLPPIE